MKTPVRVTFQDLPASVEATRSVTAQMQELARSFPSIQACRVQVSSAASESEGASLVSVRIDLQVPGGEIAVNPEHARGYARMDLAEAVRAALLGARRQLMEYARVIPDSGPGRRLAERGRIADLAPDRGWGTITTADGRRVEFRRTGVVGSAFDTLRVGEEVRFVEAPGDAGSGAVSVRRVSGRPTRHKR